MVVVVHHVLSARQGRLLGDLTEVLHLHAEPVRRIQRQWHAGLIKYAAADEALAPLRLRDPREVRAQGFEHGAPRAGGKLQAAWWNCHDRSIVPPCTKAIHKPAWSVRKTHRLGA